MFRARWPLDDFKSEFKTRYLKKTSQCFCNVDEFLTMYKVSYGFINSYLNDLCYMFL